MVEYKRKKIQLQSGGTRYYYYKIGSDGKKERISKEKYLESTKKKVGGEGNHEYRVWKEQSGIKQIYGNTPKTLKVHDEGKLKYKGLKEEINVNKTRVFIDDKKKSVTLSLNNGKRTLYFRNQSKFNDFKNKYVEKTPEEKQAIKERQNKEKARQKEEEAYSNQKSIIEKVLNLSDFKTYSPNFHDRYWDVEDAGIDLTELSDDALNKYFDKRFKSKKNDDNYIYFFKMIRELQKLKKEVSETDDLESLKNIAEKIPDDKINLLFQVAFDRDYDETVDKINIDPVILKTYFLIEIFKIKRTFFPNAKSKQLIKELSAQTKYLTNNKHKGKEFAFIVKDIESLSDGTTGYYYEIYDKNFERVKYSS